MTQFRVVESTARADVGYLQIEDLQIEGPGPTRFERAVVRHPGAAVIVAVEADRKHTLLVRQWRAALESELLEVPAGKLDVVGEPPAAAARRELEEETGHRAGRLVKLGEFLNSPGFCDERSHLYCALDLEPIDGTHAATDEEAAMTIERIALSAVDDLIAAGDIVDAKTIIGLLFTRRYLAGEIAGTEA
ncbi:MAG: NUDIX hydrolase [Acidimicrobiia bacterium]